MGGSVSEGKSSWYFDLLHLDLERIARRILWIHTYNYIPCSPQLQISTVSYLTLQITPHVSLRLSPFDHPCFFSKSYASCASCRCISSLLYPFSLARSTVWSYPSYPPLTTLQRLAKDVHPTTSSSAHPTQDERHAAVDGVSAWRIRALGPISTLAALPVWLVIERIT